MRQRLYRGMMRVLESMPHWMRDAVARLSENDSRVIRWMKARAAVGVPVPEPLGASRDLPVRVLIAPFNYAGQAQQWARTLRREGAVDARNLAVQVPGGYGFASDGLVPAAVFLGSQEWKSRQREALAGFTHLIIESFASPLGNGRGPRFRQELRSWQEGGPAVAFLCHGSDIRSPAALRQRNRFSPFDPEAYLTRRLQQQADANRRILDEFDAPVFVSTPDLLHDVPEASWLPLVVNPEPWRLAARERPLLDRSDRPVVMHAPTAPALKGSVHVDRAMRSLEDQARYHRISGKSSAEMPHAVAEADIVVDQLMVGSYGVAACEALAAGRVVVANVDPEIRELIARQTGLELPIVQADPESIDQVLAELVGDPGSMRSIAARGPHFIERIHTGEQTLQVLAPFLES